MFTFYHFTSPLHLPDIEKSGVLHTTESNVGSPLERWEPYGSHVGPDVVWLLDTPDLGGAPHGLVYPETTTPPASDKRKVRITVEVPAIRWLDWPPAQAMNPEWKATLIAGGGGEEAAARWFVWPAPIRRRHWNGITRL